MLNRRVLLGSFATLAAAAGSAARADPPPTPEAGPGPRNLITDVPGLKVGQAQDAKVRTGVTVILPDSPAVCAVDVRGGSLTIAADAWEAATTPAEPEDGEAEDTA